MATIADYAPPRVEVFYPDSDGQPMAESDLHRDLMIYAIEALDTHFRDRDDVYVSGNMFVYYERGNPESVVAPDVFVVIGAPRHKRRSYRMWEEPKGPDFIMEVTSAATRARDEGAKRGIYAYLQVPEYFQLDPTGDYLDPPLQGQRLRGRNYQQVPPKTLPDGTLVAASEVLGLELRLTPGNAELRFYDPAIGRTLKSRAEAEDEIERLRAELARLRGESG